MSLNYLFWYQFLERVILDKSSSNALIRRCSLGIAMQNGRRSKFIAKVRVLNDSGGAWIPVDSQGSAYRGICGGKEQNNNKIKIRGHY
jgi:hypothetical protein